MLRASFGTIVAIWLLNSFEISVGSIIDTSFTEMLPQFLRTNAKIVCQVFLKSALWRLKLF